MIDTKIDHIVYAVPNLEEAMDSFEKLTGCAPNFGGYHSTQGTKNALVNLGNECYLEFLTIDFENKKITKNRWMGIDLIEKPTITRWAIKANQINSEVEILKSINPKLGKLTEGERTTQSGKVLKWKLTMPQPTPKVELLPFVIDWRNSEAHPTDNLTPTCEFVGLKFYSPQPELKNSAFEKLSIDEKVVKGNEPQIKLLIKSVNGIIEI